VGGWQAQATPTPTPVASSSPDVSPSPTPVLPDFNPTPTPYGLTDIAATIESGRNQLQDIETNLNQPSPAPDIVAGLDTLLQVVAQDMPAVRLKLAQTPSGNELRDLENQWKVLATPLLDWKKRLSTRASELDDAGKSLRELKATWLAAKEVDLPVELLDGIEKLVGRMKAAEDRIRSDRDRLLVMLDRLNFVDAQIKSTLTEIANARQTQVKQVFLQDSPPLWNVNFREWPRGELVGQTLKKQLDDLTDYFKAHLERFLFHLLCFGLLVLGVGRADNRIRPWVQLEPLLERPARVFRTPFTTGMLLAYLLTPWVYPQPPIMLRAMLGATALFPAALVLSRLLDRYYHSVLKLILALFLVDQLRELIDPKVLLARLLLTGELTFIVVFLVTRFLTAPKDNIGGLPAAFLRTVAAALYGSAWILTVCGFVNLGGLLGQSTLSATYLGIMLLAMVQVLNGLILLSLRTPPLSLLASVRDFRPLYRDRLQRLVVLLARGIWLISLLEFLNLRQSLFDFVSTVLNASINVGQFPISLGKLVAFGLALIIPYQSGKVVRRPSLTNGQPRLRSMSRLKSIDILRGVAVLAVIVSHLPFSWEGSRSGATGAAMAPWVAATMGLGHNGVTLFLYKALTCKFRQQFYGDAKHVPGYRDSSGLRCERTSS